MLTARTGQDDRRDDQLGGAARVPQEDARSGHRRRAPGGLRPHRGGGHRGRPPRGRATRPPGRAAREAAAPGSRPPRRPSPPRSRAAAAAARRRRAGLGPRVEAAREAIAPRVEAARDAAAAARGLAVDRGPRPRAGRHDLARASRPPRRRRRRRSRTTSSPAWRPPRTRPWPTPRPVIAAREAVTPALESARETLAAGVDSARSELEARRAELVAARREVDPQGPQDGEEGPQGRRQEAQGVREEGRGHRQAGQARAGVEPSRGAGRGCSSPSPWVPRVVRRCCAARRTTTGPRPRPVTARAQLPGGPRAQLPERRRQDRLRRGDAPGDGTPPDTDLGTQTAQLAEGDEDGRGTTRPATPARRRGPAATRPDRAPVGTTPPLPRAAGASRVSGYRGDHE